jgi:UDP-N-acetylglucosamine:LPS N-acetylglucosamine transferase
MSETGIIICRPGYSSVMDIAATGCRAVFVPTPGQTEQEYLASYLQMKGYAFSVKEHAFDLRALLADAERYHFPSELFRRAKLIPHLEKMLFLKKT